MGVVQLLGLLPAPLGGFGVALGVEVERRLLPLGGAEEIVPRLGRGAKTSVEKQVVGRAYPTELACTEAHLFGEPFQCICHRCTDVHVALDAACDDALDPGSSKTSRLHSESGTLLGPASPHPSRAIPAQAGI